MDIATHPNLAHTAHGSPLRRDGFERLVDKIFRGVEFIAAALLLTDVVILLAGVFARYVLHDPIVWADEVAVISFLWIAMFGSAIAARGNSHMRLTVLVGRLSPSVRRHLEATTGLLCIGLLLCLIWPAIEHIHEHWDTLTPALRISDGLRLCGLLVGFLLTLLALLPEWIRKLDGSSLATAVVASAAITLVLWLSSAALKGDSHLTLALFFVVGVIACILLGVPIAFAFGLCTLAYLQFATTVPMTIMVARIDAGISEILLLSIPLFIVLGMLLEITGMARTLIAFLLSLMGHIRGGLSYVLLGAMFLVSGISGSKAADMAAVAPVLIPEMKKRGYSDDELVGLLASSGAMSETIPPSLVLIALGAVAGVSIAALFTAGLLPAAIGAVALAGVAWWRARRSADAPTMDRASRQQIATTLIAALPVLALPLIIRLAVVKGIATATEVATIGVLYTVIVGLMFGRNVPWRRCYRLLVDSAALTGVIMLILGMATAMAWALTQSGFSNDLMNLVADIPGGAIGFLLISVVVFVLLGSLLEGLPALVVLGPLMFPAAQVLGIHDVHYAMVVILAMGLGLFAPPFGVGFYMACAMAKVAPDDGMRAIWSYLVALLLVTLAVCFIPWISTVFL